MADSTFADVPNPDIILIPGGMYSSKAESPETLNWIRTANENTTWTTSVCTEALVLGKTGILKGLAAATHWAALGELTESGAIPVSNRWIRVPDGKIVTSAGVSAGIDMALYLARLLAGDEVAQPIQLCIQYDPQPPFNSGTPAKATPEMIAAAQAIFEERIKSLNPRI